MRLSPTWIMIPPIIDGSWRTDKITSFPVTSRNLACTDASTSAVIGSATVTVASKIPRASRDF